MTPLTDVCQFLERFAPPRLAEEWDNVGLLVGDPARPVARIMTCLTITPAAADEAVAEAADLIVAHHPLPFRPLKRLTSDTTPGRLLLRLIAAQVAVYSPHTAFDSAAEGVNEQLAQGLGIRSPAPLVPETGSTGPSEGGETNRAAGPPLGAGRFGQLETAIPLQQLADRARQFLAADYVQAVGPPQQAVARVAVACGAAGSLLEAARRAGCDALVLGETNFHTCLEAEACGIGLVLTGHFASERFAVDQLAAVLAAAFPQATVWASRRERDPLWLRHARLP